VLDLVVEGGLVLDGSGGAGRRLDIGVREERIVSLFQPGSAGPAQERIDAEGMVVAPGFIDIHTHLDAQVFWDPYCTPSSLYGVTSVITGNCGFSIAPLGRGDHSYMLRLLAEVEAIPAEALEEGVPWNWESFGDYLAAVQNARPAVNVGVMAGHSALRRAVLGSRHAEVDPGPSFFAEMRAQLEEAMHAGALGFSSSWNSIHVDGEGEPVPSRYASTAELLELCGVLTRFPGSQIEFIPTVGRFEDHHIDLMIKMALAGQAPLNWNVLIPEDRDVVDDQLRVSDLAAAQDAQIFALTYPGSTALRVSSQVGMFRTIDGWAQVIDLAPAAATRALLDPAVRKQLRESAEKTSPLPKVLGRLIVVDTHSEGSRPYLGMSVKAIADEIHQDVFDALFMLWIADELRTGFAAKPMANSKTSWEIRRENWSDPRVLIGASDAGAHVHLLSTFDYPATFLALIREHGGIELPAAVHKLTDVPARLYGLKDRGYISEGAYADLVVFDADLVGPGEQTWRDDLPGGAGRIYKEPTGIGHVIVNGTEIVGTGGLTGKRPGRILRRESSAV